MSWQEQYAKLVNALENEMFVFDNCGTFWYFDGTKIRLALADIENPKYAKENGYYVKNFQDALKLLKDEGYIS